MTLKHDNLSTKTSFYLLEITGEAAKISISNGTAKLLGYYHETV